MSGTASTSWAPQENTGGRQWLLSILLTLGVLATAAVTVATNGNVLAAAAPVVTVALLVAIWLAPMRVPLLALIFLGLSLDATGDGRWDSPVAPLGVLLTHNLSKTIPVAALSIPLMALLLGYLLIIHIHRLLTASRVDAAAAAARPMLWALGFSLLTVGALIAIGVKRGGDAQMAKNQVQNFVLLLLMAYLSAMSFRTKDYRILGGLILAAACIKSFMALWVFYTVLPTPEVATTHGDSLLFAGAATILLARFVERPVRRNALLCLVMLPLIFGGMIANNRRIAWVEVSMAILAFCIVTRRTQLKRFVAQAALIALPLVLVYVGAGWDSQSSFFAPVKTLRSMEDADVDRSTLFRDIENFNLIFTITDNPFVGTGFGHPYNELVKEDDISSFFKEYRFMPHNSVLGLWAFGGIFGFGGLWMLFAVGTFLAARSYRCARSPDERVAAFTTLTMVVIYMIQSWGDIGFSEKMGIFLVGPALAIAGQLALSTGAWSPRPARAAFAVRRS